jgi:hypothetical protein
VTLSLDSGSVAFLPDSLEGEGFQPMGPVQWTAEEAGGRHTVMVTYPLIALDVGTVGVPEFDIFVAPRSESEPPGLSTAAVPLGSWEPFRDAPARLPSAILVTVAGQSLEARSVLALENVTQVIGPRPPADVSGSDRHWASTLLALIFGLTLGVVLTTSARDLLTGARTTGTPDARTRALEALDGILAEQLHQHGDSRAFYRRSSDTVRGYVETLDRRWNRAWTSSELMGDLTAHAGHEATRDLHRSMARAEAVKFGGVRPTATEAESDWRVMRVWIERSPLPPEGATALRNDSPGEPRSTS